MLISWVNCVAKNPSILITCCFYCVCKYIFMLTLTEPSAFRVCGTAFDCFGVLGNIICEFLRVTSGRWSDIIVILIIIFFFERLLSVGLPVFVDFFLQKFFIKKCFLISNSFLHLFVVCTSLYMCRIHKDFGRVHQLKFVTLH